MMTRSSGGFLQHQPLVPVPTPHTPSAVKQFVMGREELPWQEPVTLMQEAKPLCQEGFGRATWETHHGCSHRRKEAAKGDSDSGWCR